MKLRALAIAVFAAVVALVAVPVGAVADDQSAPPAATSSPTPSEPVFQANDTHWGG